MIPPTNTAEHRRAYSRLVTCAVLLVLPIIFFVTVNGIMGRDLLNCVGRIIAAGARTLKWADTSIRAGFRHPRG